MKRLQLVRWSGSVLSPRTRPPCHHRTRRPSLLLPPSRLQSSAAATAVEEPQDHEDEQHPRFKPLRPDYSHLPSPPPQAASTSARLNALHARLALSPRFRIETLARCLVDPTADPHHSFNNSSLALLGNDLLGYHAAEMILCRYPRLPTAVIFAAMKAYVGPNTLASLAREWGVEAAAAPGGEVDPGLLQYLPRVEPGPLAEPRPRVDADGRKLKDWKPWNRGITSLTTKDEYFGEKQTTGDGKPLDPQEPGVSHAVACAGFVRAVFGGIYIHAGRAAAKAFFNAHIGSRKLNVGSLFEFRQPTRDLSRLCAREGFQGPVARLLSETGRASRTPVFVVGVFSGREKLGEGTGGSLDEARIRAAISALKGWYLYSPTEVRVPSDMEGGAAKQWKPVLIDGGEVIV